MAALAYGVAGLAWQEVQPLLFPAGLTTEGAWLGLLALLLATAVLSHTLQAGASARAVRREAGARGVAAEWSGVMMLSGIATGLNALLQGSVAAPETVSGWLSVPLVGAWLALLHLVSRRVALDQSHRAEREEAALLLAEQTARQLELVRRSEARFSGTFNHAAIGMALVGPDGEILLANQALHRLLDAPPGDLVGGTVYRWFDAPDVAPLQRQLATLREGHQAHVHTEAACCRADGQVLRVSLEARAFTERDDGRACLILQWQDNTPRVQAEQQLRHIAFHDSLTRLPNRGQFVAQLEAAFGRYRADATQPCAVMFLDFDRFKLINDSLGHDVGDAFLQEVAVRLRDVVPAAHLVARLGVTSLRSCCHRRQALLTWRSLQNSCSGASEHRSTSAVRS